MSRLTFNTQDTRRLPIRPALSKYSQSDIAVQFEVSEGVRPWFPSYPYRHLPVMKKDTSTEDYIVINKGKIVSVLTNMNSWGASGAIDNIDVLASGYVYNDATQTSTTLVKVSLDNSYFGYDDSIACLTVPANGGTASALPYTSLDDVNNAATYMSDGNIATSSNVLSLPANYPVGVVTEDVFQDIRGRYINYQMWGANGILCDWYVEVPYYDSNGDTVVTFGSSPTDTVYAACWKQFAFMLLDSSSNGAIAGMLVNPDTYGEYSLTATAGIQNIGRMLVTDARYPKNLTETVDTYPGTQTVGTDTGGLPAHLYKFTRLALSSNSSSYGIGDCVTAVQNGSFGVARVLLEL